MASDPPIAIPTEVTKETTTTTAPTDPLHAQAQSATTASASTHDSTPTPSAPEAQAAAVVAVAAVAAAAAADATPAEPIQPGSVNQPEVSQSALPSVVESGQAVPAPVEPAPTSHAAAVEDAPDPDEDDLDDLDDVLDQFTATKLSTSAAAPSTSQPAAPNAASPFNLPFPSATFPPPGASAREASDAIEAGILPDEADFAAQLQAGMADLLKELDANPEMSKQFEEMMKELNDSAALAGAGADLGDDLGDAIASGAGADPTAKAPTAAAGPSAAAGGEALPPADFQETIRRTMERMQTSSDTASAAAQSSAAAGSADDFMATLLKEMEGSGLGSDEDFSKMLMGMMEQLTNKEILYEPMKELDDKFPDWLRENGDKIKKADKERYLTQQTLVREIVGKFEEQGYSDESPTCREFIVERMQKMQAAGSPPPDLVGDMNAAQEALGDMDSGCPTQ